MPSATPQPQSVRFLDAGDSAVVVEFGDGIDAGINARVLALDAQLQAAGIAGLVETVPTYRSLMVQVDPLVFDRDGFETLVSRLFPSLEGAAVRGTRRNGGEG